ncbi:hypothetical protein QQP08_021154 [Theobroma cacao]|nr:hypothetical protein QQP08_021154 [Theobroma cacao]
MHSLLSKLVSLDLSTTAYISSLRFDSQVTIGDDAVISAFRLSEDRNRSLVGAILSKLCLQHFPQLLFLK